MRNSGGHGGAAAGADDSVRMNAMLKGLGFPLKAKRFAAPDDATGLPFDDDAPGRRRPIAPVGDAARALVGKFGIAPAGESRGVESENAILEAWEKVVDDDLRDRLVPEKYVGGILYLYAGSNVEIFELRRTRVRALEAKARKLAPFAKLRQIRLKTR